MNRWYAIDGAKGDPAATTSGFIFNPTAKKIAAKMKDLTQYAAALGRKQGLLPLDMTDWSGTAWFEGDFGAVSFWKNYRTGEPIVIPLRFLTWTPAPAIEESDSDFEMQLAA